MYMFEENSCEVDDYSKEGEEGGCSRRQVTVILGRVWKISIIGLVGLLPTHNTISPGTGPMAFRLASDGPED